MIELWEVIVNEAIILEFPIAAAVVVLVEACGRTN